MDAIADSFPPGNAVSKPPPRVRGQLFRKYVVLFIAVVSIALLTNGIFEIWFSYREHRDALVRIQQEQANAAAAKIGLFLKEIEDQLGWMTQLPLSAKTLEQRRVDALILLRQVPSITEYVQVDPTGHEQLHMSRLAIDAVGDGADFSNDPKFTEAIANKLYHGPVYFRSGSEPYMTLSRAGTSRSAGVSVAELNLKFVWDVVSQIKVGETGKAYVIDADGRLISHPDISLVLRDTNLSGLPQVKQALAAETGAPPNETADAIDIQGHRVLSTYATIPSLGWIVFVELPIAEAYAPLYASIARSAALLLGGLALAFLAGLFLARRMVEPIEAIRAGAARIGAGDLGQRIAVHTGDEIEALADQFNDMADQLHESYTDLENKVEARTRELTDTLEQQTATAEVLQVINASPGELAPVFDAMLEKALRLCDAVFGSLYTYDGEHIRPVALRGMPPAFTEFINEHPPTARPGNPAARVIETKRPVHVPDVMDEEMYLSGTPAARALVELGGVRALVNVPLVKDDAVVGFFAIYRRDLGQFSDKQVALLENFAAQAVIAMENARLLQELRARTDQLAQRQAELRVTFENMGDGVAMFDETQHLVAWNRRFQDILDVPDEVLSNRRGFADYIRYLAGRGEFGAGADPEEQVRRLHAGLGQRTVFERIRPNGNVIEVRQNPIPAGGFVLIYADITERKRNEEALRVARDASEAALCELKTAQANLIQAEKMASLGQLTAGIAHEIKNPLNFVNNFAELSVDLLGELKEAIAPAEAALNSDQRDEVDDVVATLTGNLRKITEHGKRADGIVKAMLEHSRGASGERRMVDINALADEALNLAYHGARAQDQSFNIMLERDFSDGIAPIEVNPQDITRVLLNLVSNGFYAASKRAQNAGEAGFDPTLKVITRAAGDSVEIRVRDNGTGIPADIRDKLFQPFFTTKPTGEGTGLGLSITYDIVTKAHGGTITVDSEVNSFTEFVVTLPRGMFANEGSQA